MTFFNSYSGEIEEFKSIIANRVSMYVCGPTVYNYAHLGNARPLVVFDTLRRVFEAQGFDVDYVSNVTDVDDKIINKAIAEGVSEGEITARYLQAYLDLRADLNIKDLNAMPMVTKTMDQIILFIKNLIASDFAYEVDGDVYFRVNKIKEYGQLSKQKTEDLEVGARIVEDTKKENPLDFTLWKKTEKGIKWQSDFGEGRPGWHTECVVMIKDYFNGLIDIHGGGMDLKFPHHENEIAQSEACCHDKIANYWLHNGMLNIDGSKMSKSLGNTMWAKDFIDTYGANVTRWVLLSSHYRSPLNINSEIIEMSKSELVKIEIALKQASLKLQLANYNDSDFDQEIFTEFIKTLNDDLNTPNSFMVIFETIKQLNQLIRDDKTEISKLSKVNNTILEMLKILGIMIELEVLSASDLELYQNWLKAKTAKDFDLADSLRAKLQERKIL
ncbi:MAG: cysteine--tRNA ligase [Erysipelotrichaceae bacterium]